MPQLGMAILIVVIVNGFFSFLQEFRSDKAVKALKRLMAKASRVIRGSGRAVVFATGMATEIGKIADLTLGIKSEASPLQKELRRTVIAISLLALSIGLTFLFLGWPVAGLIFIQAFIFLRRSN